MPEVSASRQFNEYEIRIEWGQKTVWIDNNELYEAGNCILIDFKDLNKFIEILEDVREEIKNG